jgi:hypothetical protein
MLCGASISADAWTPLGACVCLRDGALVAGVIAIAALDNRYGCRTDAVLLFANDQH